MPLMGSREGSQNKPMQINPNDTPHVFEQEKTSTRVGSHSHRLQRYSRYTTQQAHMFLHIHMFPYAEC